MSATTATPYEVVYARGAAHIRGLDEKVRGGLDSLNYSYSACAALTRNKTRWCVALRTDDLNAAIRKAEYIGKPGLCKKCRATAEETLAAKG